MYPCSQQMREPNRECGIFSFGWAEGKNDLLIDWRTAYRRFISLWGRGGKSKPNRQPDFRISILRPKTLLRPRLDHLALSYPDLSPRSIQSWYLAGSFLPRYRFLRPGETAHPESPPSQAPAKERRHQGRNNTKWSEYAKWVHPPYIR